MEHVTFSGGVLAIESRPASRRSRFHYPFTMPSKGHISYFHSRLGMIFLDNFSTSNYFVDIRAKSSESQEELLQ